MDTIIYLMLKRIEERNSAGGLSGGPSVFHIREEGGAPHLVYAEIPQDTAKCMTSWPEELFEYLVPFLGKCSSIDTVYDSSVDNLFKNREHCGWWQENWPVPEYREYRKKEYVEYLLKMACPVRKAETAEHFLILGFEDFLSGILPGYAKYMKSLQFYVEREDRGLSGLAEELNEEFGLPVSVHMLEKEPPYRGLQFFCPHPSVILDMSGEEKISVAGAAPGSVWIDIDSIQMKRRRIEVQRSDIAYFSMKKVWEKCRFHP